MRQSVADVAEQLKKLPSTSQSQLRELWIGYFGSPPCFRAQKQLLVLMLAYRLQERAHGALSKSTRKRLVALAQGVAETKLARARATSEPKPGTRLVREWHGETHVVSVLDEGAEYRGKRYRSLSEIARKITGTRWSGPAFFGLKGGAHHISTEERA